MEKQYLIQLTQDLYRLTLLFPKKDPLRYKMRELANDILAENSSPRTLEYLGVLDSFFEVVKAQNWVANQDILNLQLEYSKLDGELRAQSSLFIESRQGRDEGEDEATASSPGIPDRQSKILSFLKENGRVQVWQVKQILPEVTKRTLRRDFDRLLGQGVIERIGERNKTSYQLKVSES